MEIEKFSFEFVPLSAILFIKLVADYVEILVSEGLFTSVANSDKKAF